MEKLPLSKALILGLVFFIIIDLILLGVYFRKTATNPLVLIPLFKKKPGSCLVLEEKYCKKGKAVYYQGHFIGLGFLLPENTPIFAPFTGGANNVTFNLEKDKEKIQYTGQAINSGETHNREEVLRFSAMFFDVDGYKPVKEGETTKGEVLGMISNRKLEILGDYNLIISFSEYDYEQKINVFSESLLKKHFPEWQKD